MLVSVDRVLAVKWAYLYKDRTVRKIYGVGIIAMWLLVSLIDAIPFFPLDKEVCYHYKEIIELYEL